MPSVNKTKNLELNQWQGNEAVKREDFYTDNFKIDEAIGNPKELNTEEKASLVPAVNEVLKKVNKNTEEIGKAKYTKATMTLEASKWSENTYSLEDMYPNTQYDIEIGVDVSATREQLIAFGNAGIPVDNNNNILTALGIVPRVDIPVALIIWKKGEE